MTAHIEYSGKSSGLSGTLRSWVMISLTLLFTLLYASALIGWLKPLADEKMIVRLEPIIFVIIGYYFGRLPSQQNENTLKEEISRQTLKADAAQHAKEQAKQAGAALEEKMKNTKAALTSAPDAIPAKGIAEGSDKTSASPQEEALRRSVLAALSVLDS